MPLILPSEFMPPPGDPSSAEADEKVVYLCTEGRPWKARPDGGFQRMDIENAKIALLRGAKFMRKPYDEKNGF